uniref:ATP synthase complex subunit 8 n=1 Tax=Monomia gladiator TaxID=1295085 RepID=A0A343UA13_9EUCA|nr:ATP synthase F0 subunit 8 [Monomia gladiator]AVA09748.1 ATP synthase F0 subunit 8 [Monomia gladiator]
MPQMAPLLWLYLYFFFLLSLILFLSINYFIKPYQKMDHKSIMSHTSPKFTWKL